MGFIIHKYFLSKSLKAPPPSDNKKKKSGTQRRYSQPAYGSRGVAHSAPAEYLTVPESAYASSAISSNTFGYQSNAARRRRSSMASMRRASIAGGTVEDSFFPGSSDSVVHHNHIHRRMSLQTDSTYRPSQHQQQQQQQQDNTYFAQIDELQNSYSSHYGLEDTKEESSFGGDSEESRFRPQQRRFSTSSVGSGSNLFETNHSKDTIGTAGSLLPNSRIRQENKWLQLQLKQYQRHCSHLEAQLYGARDQLAYTNASWLDQLYDAQHKHQQEVFQTQRQAEQASNAILEEEMEELKEALLKVAEEEAKLEKKKKTVLGDNHHELDMETLTSELQAWKDRHAQSTANAKRIQDILEQEARDCTARLEESERHVAWLEEQLRAVLPTDDEDDHQSSSSNSRPINRRFVAVLQNHQAKLEDRIQELLMENAHLQRGQSEAYGLQSRVKELEASLKESQEQQAMHQTWHTHQMDYWKQETTKWKDQVQTLQRKLDEKLVSREAIRAEYSTRIESLEAENIRLKNQLENRQKEWMHQSNLKDRTIESLQSRITHLEGDVPTTTEASPDRFGGTVDKASSSPEAITPMDNTLATEETVLYGASLSSRIPEVATEKEHSTAVPDRAGLVTDEELLDLRRAKLREKELLLQVSRLEESEANAQRQIQRANDQIKVLQELVQEQNELTVNAANNNSVTLEPRSSSVSADDSCIEQLLDQL